MTPSVRKAFGAFLTAIGAAGFLAGALVAYAGSLLTLSSVDFSAGDITGAIRDSSDTTYIALAFYGRIQKYAPNGQFIRGWSADAKGGPFRIGFTPEGHVASYAERRHSTLVFDPTGRIVSEVGDGEARADSVLLPSANSSKRLVTPGAWYLRPVAGPIPAFLLFAAGLLLIWGGLPPRLRRSAT